jgi:hypothetical protein
LDDRVVDLLVSSLLEHGVFISRNLEISEVAGNHYISDALGLVFLGALFRKARIGRRWLALGSEILVTEMDRQVYPDGVDHEMSIPYHRLVAEIFMLGGIVLRNVGRDPSKEYWVRLERMLEFAAAYTRPDGSAPVWGDADDGRVLPFGGRQLNDHRHLLSVGSALFQRADFADQAGGLAEDALWLIGENVKESSEPARGELAKNLEVFPCGGFVALREGDEWHVLLDAGPVGLRGRGGHGHNDALAVEIWHKSGPLFIDPGSYVYTADPQARYEFRSTHAHNAPTLADHEANTVLGLWNLSDDARARLAGTKRESDSVTAAGSHVGYCRINPDAWVQRTVKVARHGVQICDTVGAVGDWKIRWTTSRGITIEKTAHDEFEILSSGQRFILSLRGHAEARRTSAFASPSYGLRHSVEAIEVEFPGPRCEVSVRAV